MTKKKVFDYFSSIQGVFDDYMARFDSWLSPIRILSVAIIVVVTSALVSLFITAINFNYYLVSYSPCLKVACFKAAGEAFYVQIAILKSGGQLAAFIALVLGPYVALKGYLSTASAEAFGNHIAHIGFFERFINSEIEKRDRIYKHSLDVYSLYRLIFPEADANGVYASEDFKVKIDLLCGSISESNEKFSELEKKFDFEDHRKRIISVVGDLHLQMLNSPRIDFLEAEDQVLDFMSMLTRVFCRKGGEVVFPKRIYR